MRRALFCPKCGKETENLVKGFCPDCFLEDNKILEAPNEMKIAHCKHCGKVRLSDKWLVQGKENLEEFVSSQVKPKLVSDPEISISLSPLGDGRTIATVTVSGSIDGVKLSSSSEIILKPRFVTCDECMKLSAGYHEAILQIRWKKEPKNPDKILEETKKLLSVLKKKHALSEIVGTSRPKEGIDVMIGSKKAAKKVASAFSKKYQSEIVSSFTVTGATKQGEEKKRLTYCIRI